MPSRPEGGGRMSRDWRTLVAAAAVALVLGVAIQSGGMLDIALVLIPPLLLPLLHARKGGPNRA